jgi:hypothetical protein
MTQSAVSAEEAIRMHRQFLQEILGEVMRVLDVGAASDDRLIAALEAYWQACLSRRDRRIAVIESTSGTAFEKSVEPMGKPFLMMVRAELMPRRGAAADQAALFVYDEARAIAVAEAVSGVADTQRRAQLIAFIRG